MPYIKTSAVALLALIASASTTEPTSPVRVTADGKSMTVRCTRGTQNEAIEFTLQPPEIRQTTQTGKAPGNYVPSFDSFDPWPGGTKDAPGAWSISPRRDEQNTLILGGLYRSIQSETVVITAGEKKFVEGQDYRLYADWGQIANIDGRLGKPGEDALTAVYSFATQRLDLLQIDKAGKLSIKPGKAVMVCPALPAPDEGATALAGIYIAPWRRDGKYVVAQEDIYPIHPAAKVEPINPGALQAARKKLASNVEFKIAFVGDSVTLGAEAGAWWADLWTDKNDTYVTRVVLGLRKQYPSATITPIHAAKGGTTTRAAPKLLEESLGGSKPDVVLIGFGLNDANSAIDKPPTNPPHAFKEDIRALTKHAKELGAEVILVTPLQPNPWMKNKIAERILDYRKALLELSKEENVGCADVNSAWMRQADAGVPPFSQLHNWNNHPGPAAHAIYSETILPFFAAPAAEGAPNDAPPAAGTATPSPAPAAPPTSAPIAVIQPTQIPGEFEFRPPPLPDAAMILKSAKHNPQIYGLYIWPGEYKNLRQSIKDVGWQSIRAGGKLDDDAMRMYAEDGLEIMHTVGPGTKPAKGWDKDPAAVDRFLADYPKQLDTLVSRYGPGGSFFTENPTVPNKPVKYFEITNEPNFQYVIPPDDRKPAELEAAREALYAKLLPAAYAVKQKHKDVQIVGFAAGGAAAADTRFVKNVFADNPEAARSLDIFSTHPYVQPAPPEAFSIRSWGSYSIASQLKSLRETLAGAGRAEIPVWYTEVGWPISKADGGFYESKGVTVTPLLQAAYVVRLYALCQRLGVERCQIMFATDTDNFNAGFFLRDGTWRPSAHAVKTMIKLMPRPKLSQIFDDGQGGTFIYRFAASDLGDAPDVTMAWRVADTKWTSIPYTAGPEATVTDMLGTERKVAAKDGKIDLEIGPCPVYVR